MRATAPMAGCSFNTVSKLLLDVGGVCTEFQDRTLRNLSCAEVQCDEIWSFGWVEGQERGPRTRKDEFGVGDVWCWVAIDAESKLVPSWLIGERNRRLRRGFAGQALEEVPEAADGELLAPDCVEVALGDFDARVAGELLDCAHVHTAA